MSQKPMTLAMWSGPRNLSTAMMRSFAQRADCQAWDEPFYAAYLAKTGIDHPMREEVIADGITDPQNVIAACLTPPEPPKALYYQKHMTQHMVPGIETGWTAQVTNAFLIRSPERVLASYAKKRAEVTAEDIGYSKQREMFERLCDTTGTPPLVIDSTDIRVNPETMLKRLCEALGIRFDPAMLSWKAGEAPEDGIWGKHWYDAIWKSTCFAPPEKDPPALPDHLRPVLDEVIDDFEAVEKYKITEG